jgi:hypothetical protein
MRTFILCLWIVLFSAYGITASEYKPRWVDLPCKICIERLEEQGILNIRETRIVIDDKQALVMTGGQAACAFISPGNHFIYAESYDPYDPNSKDPKAWLSNKIIFILEKGEMAEFEIRKAFDAEENQWKIIRVK